MATITEQIAQLKRDIATLKSKVRDLSTNTEESTIRPYSRVGGLPHRSKSRPIDISTGLGGTFGGYMIWNNAEIEVLPYGTQPQTPSKGYSKHSHSEFSGGALDINTLKLVEYLTNEDGNILSTDGDVLNKHCQGYWKQNPSIATEPDSSGNPIPKIGLLDIAFDPDTATWKASGALEIDVRNTYMVEYEYTKDGSPVEAGTEGATKTIAKDENDVEKKSPLLSDDAFKSNIIWDKDAQVWRFYAVFRKWEEPAEEEEGE